MSTYSNFSEPKCQLIRLLQLPIHEEAGLQSQADQEGQSESIASIKAQKIE